MTLALIILLRNSWNAKNDHHVKSDYHNASLKFQDQTALSNDLIVNLNPILNPTFLKFDA